MSDRRDFLKRTLAPAGALCIAGVLPATASAEGRAEEKADLSVEPSLLSQKLRKVTRATAWKLVEQIKVGFKTFHCQGMVKIGNDFWVSSVEIADYTGGTFDRSKGKGHLFRIDASGKLLSDTAIGEGAIYHPSGIDYDGKHIWIAAAEYRPDSQAIIYTFDPAAMKLQEIFRWQDHIGGILRNPLTNTLHGISWGSRRFYQWQLDKDGRVQVPGGNHRDSAHLNGSFYIDYQDNQWLGGKEILYTGLSVYKKPDGSRMAIGGFEMLDLDTQLPVHQVPLELWSPVGGAPITQNPSFFELAGDKVRAYFMPDDNESTIFIYEA